MGTWSPVGTCTCHACTCDGCPHCSTIPDDEREDDA